MTNADLILHPVRLRIIAALADESLTTQQIGERLPDLPQSSIYRHLKALLDGGMVRVVETQRVKGVEEKVYAMAASTFLGAADIADWTAEDFQRAFTGFMAAQLQAFRSYLARPGFDMAADMAGFTEVVFYATDEQFAEAVQAINMALVPLALQGPGPQRRRRKFATITHPMPGAGATQKEGDTENE